MLLEDLAHWDSIDDIDIDSTCVDTTDFLLPVSFTGMKDGELVTLDVEIPIICDCAPEDVGIGAHEFWGFVGCDSRMGWEIVTLDIDEDWPLKEAIIQKIESVIEDLEGPSRDYDEDF